MGQFQKQATIRGRDKGGTPAREDAEHLVGQPAQLPIEHMRRKASPLSRPGPKAKDGSKATVQCNAEAVLGESVIQDELVGSSDPRRESGYQHCRRGCNVECPAQVRQSPPGR